METKKLFGIGTKRVGFLIIVFASILAVGAMLLSNYQISKLEMPENVYIVVYRAIDIGIVWGALMGSALALVGIGKSGENKALEITTKSSL